MALGSTMLQLEVIQESDGEVSDVGEFFAETFEFLTLGTLTVREIALEKEGGVQGHNTSIPIDLSDTGYARVRLFFVDGSEVFLLSPSHVPSPPFSGAGAIILEMSDEGFTASENALQVARKLGAHVYFDEH